jgi:serine phosphatase RsbU (regulator of sigma subunit)
VLVKNQNTRRYLFTFMGVGIAIFLIGFIGISVSLKFIERNYIDIQLDVNKRHAQSMAKLLQNEVAMGLPLDTVRHRFQQTIEGTEFDKGFLCMFNTGDASLACHPDPNLIGMAMSPEFTFKLSSQKQVNVPLEIGKGQPISGLFFKGDMGTDIVHMEPIKGTPWLMAAHTNFELIQAEFASIKTNYIYGSALLGLLLAIAASVTSSRIGRVYELRIEKKNQQLAKSFADLEELNKELKNQKEEIEAQNNMLVSQKDIITKQKDDILASIEYAKRIQEALLNAEKSLDKHLTNYFLIYKPKDIVSGDFYWSREVDGNVYVAVGDSTGHGVPGAFMSVLGITLLNEIVDTTNCEKPNEMLNELRVRLKKALNQENWELDNSDGIEMALLKYSPTGSTVEVAASYQSVLVYSNGELQEIKGDRCPIGVCFGTEKKFNAYIFNLSEVTTFYMYSDGYADQMGGENHKKFYSRTLKNLIASIAGKDMADQKQLLEKNLVKHMGSRPQTDDITLMGIKLR